jgi:hypothetical protein
MDEVLAFYLSRGCPCRFPRFRAMGARDFSAVGAPGVTSSEQAALLFAYDQKAPVVDKDVVGPAWRGRCARCGSYIQRWAHEVVMSSWIEHLEIEPAPGVKDLGASLDGPLPRVRDFHAAGPGVPAHLLAAANAASPLVSEAEWFSWLRALPPVPDR